MGLIYAGCKMNKMAALCVAIACDSNTRHGQLQTRRKLYETKRTLQLSPRQGYRHQKKEYRQLIFLHTREFHRTLSEVVYRISTVR